MAEPLTSRRTRLARIIGTDSAARLSHDLPGSADDIVKALLAAGVEGIVAKRKDSMLNFERDRADMR